MCKICRDNRILATKKKQPIKKFEVWIVNFQKEVNSLFQTDKLQFILDFWVPNKETSISIVKKVATTRDNIFLFLNIKIVWRLDVLIFEIFFKPN